MLKKSWIRNAPLQALAFAVLMTLLNGCAMMQEQPRKAESLEQAMTEGDAALKAGQKEKAQGLFAQAAKDFPASKEPWLRSAQLHFEAGNYGHAIVNAQEALQRDPSDRAARSIMAVGGLRLSVEALRVLRADSSDAGSIRSEAEKLATVLRDALGEAVLVPAPAVVAEPAPAPEPVTPKRKIRKAVSPVKPQPAQSGNGTATPAAPQGGGSANPFGALQ